MRDDDNTLVIGPTMPTAQSGTSLRRLSGVGAELADGGGNRLKLSVATDKGANAGRNVTSLVAGMVAGADSIDDMALLHHGAMGKAFHREYAPESATARRKQLSIKASR
ncbi:hypothetical protein DEU38_123107 [Rhodococcus sp. AG1013]|nr:hypothetical protein DEU38_123107 [Rhodococcus sp. AG1013]